MNKEAVFLDRLNWLYENDYDRFKIIEALINAMHNNEEITIGKDVNLDKPVISISINREYIQKHQCFSEEEANALIDLAKISNKYIKRGANDGKNINKK